MKRIILTTLLISAIIMGSFAQENNKYAAQTAANSVFNTLKNKRVGRTFLIQELEKNTIPVFIECNNQSASKITLETIGKHFCKELKDKLNTFPKVNDCECEYVINSTAPYQLFIKAKYENKILTLQEAELVKYNVRKIFRDDSNLIIPLSVSSNFNPEENEYKNEPTLRKKYNDLKAKGNWFIQKNPPMLETKAKAKENLINTIYSKVEGYINKDGVTKVINTINAEDYHFFRTTYESNTDKEFVFIPIKKKDFYDEYFLLYVANPVNTMITKKTIRNNEKRLNKYIELLEIIEENKKVLDSIQKDFNYRYNLDQQEYTLRENVKITHTKKVDYFKFLVRESLYLTSLEDPDFKKNSSVIFIEDVYIKSEDAYFTSSVIATTEKADYKTVSSTILDKSKREKSDYIMELIVDNENNIETRFTIYKTENGGKGKIIHRSNTGDYVAKPTGSLGWKIKPKPSPKPDPLDEPSFIDTTGQLRVLYNGKYFNMDKYEVTNEKYILYLNSFGSEIITNKKYLEYIDIENKYSQIELTNNKFVIKDETLLNIPVVCVTHIGAEKYAQSKNGRLPSTDEWTFFAKGGETSEDFLFVGGNKPEEVAWFCETTKSDKPQFVGILTPNKFGLYDMSGNVAEWTSSTENGKQIVKGGSFTSGLSDLRPEKYRTIKLNQSSHDIGFRVIYEVK